MSKWDIPDNINFSNYENPLQKIIGETVNYIQQEEENEAIAHITKTLGYHIDKEELVKALNYDRDQYAKGYKAGLNADRWIPIKTRPLTEEEQKRHPYDSFIYDCPLPNDGQEVLITDCYGNVETDVFCIDCDGCYFETNYDDDEVIAWQPLPSPFKTGDEE